MCGILAIFHSSIEKHRLRRKALNLSKILRHRGPDWNGIVVEENDDGTTNVLAHERLAIVDVLSGHQPLYDDEEEVCLTINGEIYNHLELRKLIKEENLNKLKSCSDCAVIPNLFKIYKEKIPSMLDGIFAGVISDKKNNTFFAFRDPIGICPLYIGYAADGSIWFSSEFKALKDNCIRYVIFPPGHYYKNNKNKGEFVRYYNPNWWSLNNSIPNNKVDFNEIRIHLEKAVIKRLMGDVPFGILLSGGLDSSIIAAILAKHLNILDNKNGKSIQNGNDKKSNNNGNESNNNNNNNNFNNNNSGPQKLRSFSIGLKGSPDLKAAKEVAEYLGIEHTEFYFTVEEGIDSLHDVIYHIETYDITTIRASTPMYILSRLIKSSCVKMVLSGEGSDEIFGGYLYFHKAPNKEEFHRELQRKIHDLHYYDVLRANKSTMAFGIEARVPFLDIQFLNVVMNIDPQDKMCSNNKIEKYILRKAFEGYLPEHILYRQKEQFSDGVGYNWIDGLKQYAEKKISDIQFSRAKFLFPYNTPKTKEGYLYRCIFSECFPEQCAQESVPQGESIACSTSKAVEWDESFKQNADQSGRSVLGIHRHSKQFDDVKCIPLQNQESINY
ncbi:asparagine synthase (glutamine-hydrolyzing) [Plasmodium falciparum Santa Lucia]|uniref:asparagine synthase (glutamine-hydrolyzing) n=20 Tax=Plasmodium falciparum TaxID=5833 RepID=O77330_PLAF7|nr:asparagine synthetase [glutamine-hydrolyzing], putative [Plasmodium falciparum 3D7]ETW20707.1 asparagine synthase (glutamine-hydrolyzing) [Plasmodium falciparum Vietnam Oak-Knoll (FVO)]ETW32422.1 asparagine synthase (glutamine-hydrolyzing) [Plasmodium falciparum FCH/4]ETW45175.1 asparagine synthase (glutamine-hydrolyzing) [Plasmodium falciparum NF135/5.C10]ETW51518.1 asparagine synthase (glutamine-hydrolyzing) [Plasmodium falciparum MaliPS096_E11]ETW52231.1 asparagine synthase (glutamine-hy|eukprot:XP_001351168.1 asparagine synthetase [glutamine-hydrolyzing],putative [Plasmodium falciparum 3D7]